jgi:hypothetical protein
MATKANEKADQLTDRNHHLRKALDECRELLARTQELLERAHRMGSYSNDD